MLSHHLPCSCGATAVVGQTSSDIEESKLTIEFYGQCNHESLSQAGRLSGEIKSFMKDLVRSTLGPDRNPGVFYEQLLLLLNADNPGLQQFGNRLGCGTKLSIRSSFRDERLSDCLGKDELTALMRLKRRIVKEEDDNLPQSVRDALIVRGYIHTIGADPFFVICFMHEQVILYALTLQPSRVLSRAVYMDGTGGRVG